MKPLILALLVACSAFGQTVYLRDSAPAAVSVVDVSNATPVVVHTASDPGYSVGDTVDVWNTCMSPGPSTADGHFKVKARIDATHFSITDLAGVDIAPNGGPCDWAGQTPAASWTGKTHAYSLGAQPLGLFDGPTGKINRKLRLSTDIGLVSLVVASNVATVATSYANGMTTGDQLGVWGSTNSNLNHSGLPYTVTVVDATHFTFPTSSVSDGDYTHNDHCGPKSPPDGTIGGTDNCLVLSQTAYAGSAQWENLMNSTAMTFFNAGEYQSPLDGGTCSPSSCPWQPGYDHHQQYALAAERFMVEKTNTAMLNICEYSLKHVERAEGVNWTTYGGTGNTQNTPWDYIQWSGIAVNYQGCAAYLSPADKQMVLDKLWNDKDDPAVTACSEADAQMSSGHNTILGSGTATAVSGTSITLQADPGVNIVNDVIAAVVSGSISYGLVTAWNSGTRAATVASWSNGTPSGTPAYTVYATVSYAGSAFGTATLTGYNTHFLTDLSAGDAAYGMNAWNGNPEASILTVISVTDDTHATVLALANPPSATPVIGWWAPKWKTGDCGLAWHEKFWPGSLSQSPLYFGGGTLTNNPPYGPVEGGNNSPVHAHLVAGFSMSDEPRALRDLERHQNFFFDWELRPYMNYKGGTGHSGSTYNWITTGYIPNEAATVLALSVPTFPDMDLAGPWMNDFALCKIFCVLPDFNVLRGGEGIRMGWPIRTGTDNNAPQLVYYNSSAWVQVMDPIFLWSPNSRNAKYLRDWFDHSPQQPNLWSNNSANAYVFTTLLHNDPRQPASDYTAQPHQYAFMASSSARCAALTGWPCPDSFKGSFVISRTGWSSLSDSFLYVGARSFWSDHDSQENGTVRFNKATELLFPDSSATGNVPGEPGADETVIGDLLNFGGVPYGGLKTGFASNISADSPISSWAAGNHGTWPAAYGDQASESAHVCIDLAPAYNVAANWIKRCVPHLKKSGRDEFFFVSDSVSLMSATSITTRVHYAQNGESAVSSQPEGSTGCGAGGCASLDTNRRIISLETGVADGVGDVTPNFGLITDFITSGHVAWLCPLGGGPGGSDECSPSSTYAGGLGHTDAGKICAGTCGSNQTSFESITVHKVAVGTSDTSLATVPLNPDSNWKGVQACGVRSCAVYVRGLGGTNHGTMTSFATVDPGTSVGRTQYLVADLNPGIYNVAIDGTPVAGSPFVVASGDNSLAFDAPAGTFTMSAGANTLPGSVSSGVTFSGIHY